MAFAADKEQGDKRDEAEQPLRVGKAKLLDEILHLLGGFLISGFLIRRFLISRGWLDYVQDLNGLIDEF
jgi:hypothetical protein